MITVAPPLKKRVSPVLVIIVTDGGPSCEITCARDVPAGNGEIVAGIVGTVAGIIGIGETTGRPIFDGGNACCGNTGGTLMITVFPDRKPNSLR